MSRKGKRYVLGYYVLKSGAPCVLDAKLHSTGLLVLSADGQALTVFDRAETTLWAAKTRAIRAVERTERAIAKFSKAGHLEFPTLQKLLASGGKFTIHPCKNSAPTLAAQQKPKPKTRKQQRMEVLEDL